MWDKVPDKLPRIRLLYRNVRQSAVSYVLHTLVVNADNFESLKAEFVEIVLGNNADHL